MPEDTLTLGSAPGAWAPLAARASELLEQARQVEQAPVLEDPSVDDTQERHRPIGHPLARWRDLSEYARVGSLFHHARGDEVSFRDDVFDGDPCVGK